MCNYVSGSTLKKSYLRKSCSFFFLAIQNTSYLCPLSIRGFADSAQWMLSDVTPALGHAPSAPDSGLWLNVLLEVSTLGCSSSVPVSQWFSGTFLLVSLAFIEQGQRCRHSAMDDMHGDNMTLQSYQIWMPVKIPLTVFWNWGLTMFYI